MHLFLAWVQRKLQLLTWFNRSDGKNYDCALESTNISSSAIVVVRVAMLTTQIIAVLRNLTPFAEY